MPGTSRILRTVAACAMALLVTATAHAQAARTWVSGVGDDVNPCSRTAPCKTFAGAISKTAAGGEIDALDPGGYGTLTITKGITLDGAGTMASILNSGGINGIVIIPTTGSPIQVVLRNLSINGTSASPGLNGIRVLGSLVASVTVENTTMMNFSGFGIDFQTTTASFLFVNNVSIRNAAGGGISVKPFATGPTGIRRVSISNSEFNGGAFGVKLDSATLAGSVAGAIRNSTAAGAGGTAGFWVSGNSASLVVADSLATANIVGLRASAGGTLRVVNSWSSANTNADQVAETGGIINVSNNGYVGPP